MFLIREHMKEPSGHLPSTTGWHREDIKAAIRKRGVTCSELSQRFGYAPAAIRKCLHGQRWSHVERQIARFLGVAPYKIWPERWTKNGKPRYRAQARRKGHSA